MVISTGLLARLSQAQLLAVLAHEASHARQFDPLALLAARVGRAGLWFLPFVGRLLRLCELRIEFAADAAAVQLAGRSSLVVALLAMGEDPGPSPFPRAASAEQVLALRTEALWAQRLPRVCSATHLWAASALVLGLVWVPMLRWVAPPPFRAPMIGQVHVLR